jgi:hypothetical protein
MRPIALGREELAARRQRQGGGEGGGDFVGGENLS